MASNKIKGITIEIGGDTTKLGKAIDEVSKGSRDLQTELNQINKMLKFDPTNTELLAQKQQVLAEQIGKTEEKLKLLREAEAQVQAQFERGDIGADQYRAFQREIQSTENYLNSLNDKLNEVDNELKGVNEGTSKASSAFSSLTSDINKQERELDDLKQQYVNVVLEQGKNSDSARELQSRINSLNSELNENKTRLNNAQEEADQLTKSLDDLGDEAKNTEGGFTIMKGALADLASNAIQNAVSAVSDFVSGLFELSEATEEYRTMMSKVEGSATSFGYEIEWAKDKYKEFYTYLNDDQMATNAITNLMGLQLETSKLEDLVDGAIGVWASYGDSIPIESLTESINETIQVGKVTGVMADTINWAKLSNEEWTKVLGKNSKAQKAFNKALEDGEAVEDAFSSALASTTDTGERAEIVARMLNDTYGESKRVYDENTEAILENREAQAELKEIQAEVGETLQPLNTEFTRLQGDILKSLTPAIEKVAEKILEVTDDIDWEGFADTLGDLLSGAIDGIAFLIDNIDLIVAGLGGATVAWGAYKLATEGATIAQKLFNIAQNATPWGLIATLIGGAVTVLGAYVASTQDATEKVYENVEATNELVNTYEDLNDELQKSKEQREESLEGIETEYRSAEILADKLDELSKVEDKSNGQKALMKEYVDQLNEVMPELNLQYDEEKDKLNLSTEAIKNNIEASKELAITKAKQEFLTDIAKEMAQLELEQAKAVEQHKENQEELEKAKEESRKAQEAFEEKGAFWGAKEGERWKEALEHEEKMQQAYDESQQLVDSYGDKLNELSDDYDTLAQDVENSFNSIEIEGKLDTLVAQAQEAGIKIPQALSDNIKAGTYAVPASVDELKALITFDDLVQKATTSGLQIPQSIASGIKSGELKPSQAISQMNNLVEFNTLLEKANLAGEQVPDFLAQKIAEGNMKPNQAVDQMERLVEFNELLEKTELAGASVPQELQEEILAGKIKPEDAVNKMRDEMLTELEKIIPNTATVGGQAVNRLEESLKKNKVASITSKMASGGIEAMEQMVGGFKSAGEEMIRGAEQGANNRSSTFGDKLWSIAKSALNSFKSALGIKSPSKEFEKATEWVPEGMAVGVENNKQVALNAISDLADDMIKEAEKLNDIEYDDIHIGTTVDKPIVEDLDTPILNGNLDRQLDSTFTMNDINITDSLERIFDLLSDFLPYMNNQVILDTGTLVGEMAPLMDRRLGQIKERNKRI